MNVTKQLKKHSREISRGIKQGELTKMDKLRAHYLENRKLPKTLEETREKLEKANGLLCSGYSREQAVRFLVEGNIVTSRSHAYKIVREALELFGDVTKSSKEGLRHVITEGLMQVYNSARHMKNLEVQERVLVSIARINHLYNGEENGKTVAGSINILFTSDANVLVNQEQEFTSHVEITS